MCVRGRPTFTLKTLPVYFLFESLLLQQIPATSLLLQGPKNALATYIGLLRPCRTPNQVGPYGMHPIMVYCHLWGSKPCLSICLEVWQLSSCLSHMSIVHTWYYIILLRASIFTPFMVIASTMEVDITMFLYVAKSRRLRQLRLME